MKPSEIINIANRESYALDYANIVASGGGLSRWVYNKSHRDIERGIQFDEAPEAVILEVGAQADQHRKWVVQMHKRYIVSDIELAPLLSAKEKYLNELNLEIPEDTNISEVKFEEINAESIPYAEKTFDRLIATCLIAHLDSPADALHEWRRVMKNNGLITFYVPCEPGFMLRIARRMTHKRAKRVSKYSYDLLEYSQHKNHFPAIHEFTKFVFEGDLITRKLFPFNFLPWDFNLWAVYKIRVRKV